MVSSRGQSGSRPHGKTVSEAVPKFAYPCPFYLMCLKGRTVAPTEAASRKVAATRHTPVPGA